MASLISAITIKNFKGFSEEIHIQVRPITLLFGANSAGKSSVLHALHLVREVLERGNPNVDRTLQGGDTIDLGGFLNYVHNRDRSRQVSLSVEMQLGDESIPEFFEDPIEDRSNVDAEVWHFHETLHLIRNQVRTVDVQLTLGWSELRGEAVVSGYCVSFNGEWCAEVMTGPDGRQPRLRLNAKHSIFLGEEVEGVALFDEVADWVLPGDGACLFRADLGVRTEVVEGEEDEPIPASILLAILEVVRGSYADSPSSGFAGWLQGFQGALPPLDKPILIPASRPEKAANVFALQEFSAFMSWLLIGPALLLRDQLRKSRYLGPLRRVPPRGFDVALSMNEAAWSDGMAAWQTLLGGTESLVATCSDWMANDKKLTTGYGVERTVTQEFDVSGPEPKALGGKRPRVALVDMQGSRHLPQDVGVGISQVLPVVVAAQDGSASVVCIEQPELHIHPAVQVGLGDLFIDGALNQGLSFLIETHSEHLILRLLRRIREAAEASSTALDKRLSPSLIGVNCLSKRGGTVVIDEIPVISSGEFAKPWPHGFFDERGEELFG
jgi:hypothetical protein